MPSTDDRDPEHAGVASPAGLTDADARRRLAIDGPNELPRSKPRGRWRLLREVVTEPMFLLLVACGALYLVLGDRHEALMLLGFVVVVMGISFAQQRRSQQSLEALRDLSSPRAQVVRDGVLRRIAARELVSGDRVLLAEGDRVPADIELLACSNLVADESLLTGESVPVMKQSAPSAERPADDLVAPAAEQTTRVWAGTLITAGTATGRVVATGERSALGRIGRSLSAIETAPTPIQRETARVVTGVAATALALAAALALIRWWLVGDALQGLLAGLTLAMALVPEELPVVLTLFLGLGARRLAREHVLASNIPAIEALGATTVLCVDKTGTLTANRMALRRLWCDGESYQADANEPAGLQEALHGLLEYALLASHRRAFDPMEHAIAEAAQRLLAGTEHLHGDWTVVDDYPLSADLLAMSRVWQSPDRLERLIAAKGAPEAIVDLCHLPAERGAAVLAQVDALAASGLRVLGVARATFGTETLPAQQHDFAFEFLGLLALEDPVRPDVPQAIADCRAAGIRVVMMTGDHPATALSVARQAGLHVATPPVTGHELEAMSDTALSARLADTAVYCRVQPEQKLRLVRAFRARGDRVAMTGDGVNDAPALKAADIGVAMGARGSDVAREAAALVLLDDDFGSLVTAVRHGRRVFANLRKAIVFVVAVHVPIVGLSIVPVLLGWPMLLMPVHILFLQLIIDPACSVVFEAEPAEPDAMTVPPRRPDQRLFDADVLARGLWQGFGLLLILLGVFVGARSTGASQEMTRALTFTVLVLANLGLIHANRTWRRSVWPGTGATNRAALWMMPIALILLAAVVGIPPIASVFAFERPTPALLLGGLVAAAFALGWFELVKHRVSRHSDARSRTDDGLAATYAGPDLPAGSRTPT